MHTSPTLGIRRLIRVMAPLLAVVLLMTACGTPQAPQQGSLDLQGTWLVTPFPGTIYGAAGTSTLRFGAGAGGSATFLSRSDRNDITKCERHVFAKLAGDVVLLDEEYYVANQIDANTIELSNDTDGITLSRIEGAGPVAPCGEATLTQLGAYPQQVGSWTTLSAYGTNLYFNIDAIDDPIVSFDTANNTFGPPRIYSNSVSGGKHRWVVAAKSAAIFYGQCACGSSESADQFNLDTNTSISVIETPALGNDISVRYGYFNGATVTIGGRSGDADGVNRLLTLDAVTDALISTRDVLDGARIGDIALLDGQLLALVDRSLIVVGDDGRAEETITFELGLGPKGLATIGDRLYMYASIGPSESGIYEVTLP